jgi:hypothetical protein
VILPELLAAVLNTIILNIFYISGSIAEKINIGKGIPERKTDLFMISNSFPIQL